MTPIDQSPREPYGPEFVEALMRLCMVETPKCIMFEESLSLKDCARRYRILRVGDKGSALKLACLMEDDAGPVEALL